MNYDPYKFLRLFKWFYDFKNDLWRWNDERRYKKIKKDNKKKKENKDE